MLEIKNLPITKTDILLVADDAVKSIIDTGDVLAAAEQLSAMDTYIDAIKKDKRFMSAVRDEIEKGGKLFTTKAGTKLETAETGTKYDYSGCNDAEYNSLLQALEAAKKAVSERESFLKGVPTKGFEIVDTESGEVITIYPPVKTSTSSFKVTLSK